MMKKPLNLIRLDFLLLKSILVYLNQIQHQFILAYLNQIHLQFILAYLNQIYHQFILVYLNQIHHLFNFRFFLQFHYYFPFFHLIPQFRRGFLINLFRALSMHSFQVLHVFLRNLLMIQKELHSHLLAFFTSPALRIFSSYLISFSQSSLYFQLLLITFSLWLQVSSISNRF